MTQDIHIRLLNTSEIFTIVPFLQQLASFKISEETHISRLKEMVTQNYACAGIYDGDTLIGCSGLWFQMRHYVGRSIEMDHVFIDDNYRNRGIGERLIAFVREYAAQRDCRTIELNAYVHNFPAHKFFYNQGFMAKGYHFVKMVQKGDSF